MPPSDSHTHLFTGLDGSNPLAFLAALGAFRSLSDTQNVRMSWKIDGGAWKPQLHFENGVTRDALVSTLDNALRTMANHPVLTFAPDLKVSSERFRALSQQAVDRFFDEDDAVSHQFLSAFGCDAVPNKDGNIEDTSLRTMSGAGHQHFIGFMNELAGDTTADQLAEALFGPWRYADPSPSLRFDPADDRRYALRWKNPSQDAVSTVRGANRLAVEGIPLLPTAPVNGRLETTAFTGHRSNNTYFTWPIWTCPISLDLARSLLAHPSLAGQPGDTGIAAVYRSQRITIGKYRNFTPASAI